MSQHIGAWPFGVPLLGVSVMAVQDAFGGELDQHAVGPLKEPRFAFMPINIDGALRASVVGK